jgi:hypothetical protein
VAYITSQHPDLDDWLRGQFRALGVGYREKQIGVYRIFYQLSWDVRPADLGLGGGCRAVECLRWGEGGGYQPGE